MSDTAVPKSTFVDYCISGLKMRSGQVAFTFDARNLTGVEALSIVYRTARALRDRGVARGDCVCVLSSNLPEAYLTQVAIQLIGARYVGLHPLGSADDHRFVIVDSNASVLVYDPAKFAVRAEEIAVEEVTVFSLGPGSLGIDLFAAAANLDDTPLPAAAAADDVASIFYTGGTSGAPKGVVHTHASLLSQALLVQGNWQWPDAPVLMAVSPITHAAGQMIAPALAHHGRVVLVDGFDPEGFLKTIEQERVSVTFVVPTMLYVLLNRPDIMSRDLTSLRTVVYGAAPIAMESLQRAHEVFGDVLLQGYGQTEIGVGALVLRKEDHRLDRPGRLASAGRTPPGITAAILDEDGAELPDGQAGELCLQSTSVMVGYWNQPELTAETLLGGWLHTGDIGVRDRDGFIAIVDRKKDMIVSGGFNVYPKEIEDVLHSHPDVRLAAVVGLPDQKWGEAVHATVVLAPGSQVTVEELRDLVKNGKGPIYAPKSFDFTTELPATALGKIDKKKIRVRAAESIRARAQNKEKTHG